MAGVSLDSLKKIHKQCGDVKDLFSEMKAVVQTFNLDSSMDLGKAQWWETPLLLLGGPGSQRGATPS